jgi:hypothetical protein
MMWEFLHSFQSLIFPAVTLVASSSNWSSFHFRRSFSRVSFQRHYSRALLLLHVLVVVGLNGSMTTVEAFRSIAVNYHQQRYNHHSPTCHSFSIHPSTATTFFPIHQSRRPTWYTLPTTLTFSSSSSSTFSSFSTKLQFSNFPPPEGSFIDINSNDDDDDDDDDENNDNDNRASNNILNAMEDVVFIVLDPNENDEDDEEEEEEEDDHEEEEEHEDPYTKVAASEFQNSNSNNNDYNNKKRQSALTVLGNDELGTTMMDWGKALTTLRERAEDVETGKSQDPSHILFRMMSTQTPNQIIGQFISNANPMVVQAMSGAIGSLLGGLSNPNMGVETIVKASGEKIGSLCFQLQMTGTFFELINMLDGEY